MLQINDNTDELIIREGNASLWGGFVTLFVCAILGGNYLLSILKGNAVISIDISSIVFLAAMFYMIVTIFYMVINPGTTIKLNKKSKLLAIEKKGLFKNSLKFYPFREIAGLIYVEEIGTAKGNTNYELVMNLKSGEEIKFLSDAASNTGEYFNAANFMNDVIFDSPDKVQFKSSAFNEISS